MQVCMSDQASRVDHAAYHMHINKSHQQAQKNLQYHGYTKESKQFNVLKCINDPVKPCQWISKRPHLKMFL